MHDVLTVAIRFALYADLMLLFGLPLFACYMQIGSGNRATSKGVVIGLALAGLSLSLLSIVAMTASMMAGSIGDVEVASVYAMIVETPMGNAWAVRITVLAAIAVSAMFAPQAVMLRLALAAIALASLAWTGHGAAGEGVTGNIRLFADIVHLLAAGAWMAAIVHLVVMVVARVDAVQMHCALDGFASAGTILVGLVVVSGLINANFLIGWRGWATAGQSTYGALFLLKIVLFIAMLAIAATNRFHFTPTFGRAINEGRTYPAARGLTRSLILELSLATAILGLVAWLGTLEPPMSM